MGTAFLWLRTELSFGLLIMVINIDNGDNIDNGEKYR